MKLKEIVASYATEKENKTVVDIQKMAKDEEFRKEVIKEVLAIVKRSAQACVVIPAFKSGEKNDHLGQLINELALTLQVKTLVTGKIENFKRLRHKPTEVIILKQSFREGTELQTQVSTLKAMGCKVQVLCFLAHSATKLKKFADENAVSVQALVDLG